MLSIYYKQGLRYGDLAAAEKYLRRYYELGGTEKGLAQSVKRIHPLGGLVEKDWRPFLATLSPEEMESFRLALKWYNETYQSAPAAQIKVAARIQGNSESGIERPNSPRKAIGTVLGCPFEADRLDFSDRLDDGPIFRISVCLGYSLAVQARGSFERFWLRYQGYRDAEKIRLQLDERLQRHDRQQQRLYDHAEPEWECHARIH
jgi:hypothetical protein